MRCCACKKRIRKGDHYAYVLERRPSGSGRFVYRHQCQRCRDAGRTTAEYERMAHGVPWERRKDSLLQATLF